MALREYRPWGHAPASIHTAVHPVVWRSDPPALAELTGTVLPFAYGRSYGDSCLNDGGALLDVAPLNRFVAFDVDRGLVRCEAGVTLADILTLVVPRGWFLPVVPGTKWVSIGGAIANDIHGKNHHRVGTFGSHVRSFELLRSNGARLLCSPAENVELFRATIGGLGLTGLILWAEVQLKPIPGRAIAMESIRFRSLEEFFELSGSDSNFEYTVAWIDCLRRRGPLGRGLFMRGNHAAGQQPASSNGAATNGPAPAEGRLPLELLRPALNRPVMRAFNALYYRRQIRARVNRTVPYDPFFFPLDVIPGWNRLYGPQRFLQYQCVVPDDAEHSHTWEILDRVRRSDQACFLAVLKKFGNVVSPGLLSFPRPGVTVAMDFAFHGKATLDLLEQLDHIVAEAGGGVYPAKDARMSGPSFRRFFPQWEVFAQHIDPKFSSSFWRRVTAV